MTKETSNDNVDPTDPLNVEGMRQDYIDAIGVLFKSRDLSVQTALSVEMGLLDDPKYRNGLILYMFDHIKRLSHENDEMRKALMSHAEVLRQSVPAIAYTQKRLTGLEEYLGFTYEEPEEASEEGAQLQ